MLLLCNAYCMWLLAGDGWHYMSCGLVFCRVLFWLLGGLCEFGVYLLYTVSG